MAQDGGSVLHRRQRSIQHAAVRHILTSVVDALLADPTKTFVYAEAARWCEQTPRC